MKPRERQRWVRMVCHQHIEEMIWQREGMCFGKGSKQSCGEREHRHLGEWPIRLGFSGSLTAYMYVL